MSLTKYKVGDKVRVTIDYPNNSRLRANETVTIENIHDDGKHTGRIFYRVSNYDTTLKYPWIVREQWLTNIIEPVQLPEELFTL